jgi:DNA polymerase I-like protein with 3'-5' exonuclease and polymerase domains
MEKPNTELFVINTEELFCRLMKYSSLVESEILVLDVETDSPIEKIAKLWGIGLCFNEHKAFYIVWRDKFGNKVWNEEQKYKIINWLKDISSKKKLVGHNIIYDILVIENNLGIDLCESIYSDTMLQKHTVDEDPPFALKEISVKILGEWADKAQEKLKENVIQNGGKFLKDQKDMYKADTEVLAEYCNWDVILTYLLFLYFEKKLEEENVLNFFYKEEVMPLYKEVTINMKRKGFPVDVPYYKNLNVEIKNDIDQLEKDILLEIETDIAKFTTQVLEKEAPIKCGGKYPIELAKILKVPLPINKKTSKITLAKKAIESQKKEFESTTLIATGEQKEFYRWLIVGDSPKISPGYLRLAQENLFFSNNPNDKYLFNLKSNQHLSYLYFNVWKFQPINKTEKGNPQLDDEFLDNAKNTNNPVIKKITLKLIDFKKLNKLLSTYIEGILERQINGVIYTSMLQHGTTSGRYSSKSPNLQNQPRIQDATDSELSPLVLKYFNAIRKGFIAGIGNKVVGADYSALEPRAFAHMSDEPSLKNVFIKGEDLYSRVAIDVFKVRGVSAIKKDKNYLGNTHKEFRQKSKIFCLAVVYGAEEVRISDAMGISRNEAREIIKAYLEAYPNLRKYMSSCNKEADEKGYVETIFGRKRHLKRCKYLHILYGKDLLDYSWAKRRNLLSERREYKNLLNNAKNFKIQGLAAHIVNRSAIAIAKKFKEEKLNAYIALQVHDELLIIAKEEDSTKASEIMKQYMENTVKISIPLIAEPIIGDNWKETK